MPFDAADGGPGASDSARSGRLRKDPSSTPTTAAPTAARVSAPRRGGDGCPPLEVTPKAYARVGRLSRYAQPC